MGEGGGGGGVKAVKGVKSNFVSSGKLRQIGVQT